MQQIGRACHIVNLDPAAEAKKYEFTVDIRDLISLEDVMEELSLGPNGGLIYCFEFLLKNLDWLDDEIGDYSDEFLIIDCPGQIELYTHIPIFPTIINHLMRNLNFQLCCTYLMESTFAIDRSKFFSGTLSAMSTMLLLELPHINILSKIDLVKDQISKKNLKKFLNPDPLLLADGADDDEDDENNALGNKKFQRLNKLIANLIDEFGMVQYLPLDINNDGSVATILSYIDDVTQWAENQEPKDPNDEAEVPDEDDE